MRRTAHPLLTLLLASVFFACSAASQLSPTVTYQATQLVDGGSVPSGATDGFSLNGVRGYRVCIQEVNGLLTGVGTVQDWLYPLSVAGWGHNKDLDLSVGVTDSNMQCWADFQTVITGARFKPVITGAVSNDGGTQAVVTVDYVQE